MIFQKPLKFPRLSKASTLSDCQFKTLFTVKIHNFLLQKRENSLSISLSYFHSTFKNIFSHCEVAKQAGLYFFVPQSVRTINKES